MCLRTFACERINAAAMENTKEILKKIFGDDIYLFIHLPALFINALVHPQSLRIGHNSIGIDFKLPDISFLFFFGGFFLLLLTLNFLTLNVKSIKYA